MSGFWKNVSLKNNWPRISISLDSIQESNNRSSSMCPLLTSPQVGLHAQGCYQFQVLFTCLPRVVKVWARRVKFTLNTALKASMKKSWQPTTMALAKTRWVRKGVIFYDPPVGLKWQGKFRWVSPNSLVYETPLSNSTDVQLLKRKCFPHQPVKKQEYHMQRYHFKRFT